MFCAFSSLFIVIQSHSDSLSDRPDGHGVECFEDLLAGLTESIVASLRLLRPSKRLHQIKRDLVVPLKRLRVVRLVIGLGSGPLLQYFEEAVRPLSRLLALLWRQVLADELHEHKVVSVHVSDDILDLDKDRTRTGVLLRSEVLHKAQNKDQEDLLLSDEFLRCVLLEKVLHFLDRRMFGCLPPPLTELTRNGLSQLYVFLDLEYHLFFSN